MAELESFFQNLWAHVIERPEVYVLWIVLLVLGVFIYSHAMRAAVHRHKTLTNTLEKNHYLLQELFGRVGDEADVVKGALAKYEHSISDAIKQLSERIDIYKSDKSGEELLKKIESMLAHHRELISKQGIYVFDEAAALSNKLEQLKSVTDAIDAKIHGEHTGLILEEVTSLSAKSEQLKAVVDTIDAKTHAEHTSLILEEVASLSTKGEQLKVVVDAIDAKTHPEHTGLILEEVTSLSIKNGQLRETMDAIGESVRQNNNLSTQQIAQLQKALSVFLGEAESFEKRLGEIGNQVNLAWHSVQQADSASKRIIEGIRDASALAPNANVTDNNSNDNNNT